MFGARALAFPPLAASNHEEACWLALTWGRAMAPELVMCGGGGRRLIPKVDCRRAAVEVA